jgi:hypothetical protein
MLPMLVLNLWSQVILYLSLLSSWDYRHVHHARLKTTEFLPAKRLTLCYSAYSNRNSWSLLLFPAFEHRCLQGEKSRTTVVCLLAFNFSLKRNLANESI